MSNAQHWIARKGQPLQGSLTIPGDKSVSHRSVMFAALADGTSHIEGFLEGEDTRATARIFSQLGVRIETPSPSQRIVHGVGIDGLKAPDAPLDCGNAGTGMRLLAGLLAGQAFDCTLIGDESLSGRPMRRVTGPLSQMGAKIDTQDDGTPPLHVHGGQTLHGIDFASPVASAQIKSAVLLAGLYAQGETRVTEPHPTRDYTERMLSAFGVDIEFSPGKARLRGGQRLRATDIVVPADFLGGVLPGRRQHHSRLRAAPEAGRPEPRRTGLLHALRLMGADITEENPAEQGGEPVADLVVRYAPLKGARIPEALVPDMIDEFPALFVAAAAAEGQTVVSGAAELRVKESDRLAAMATGLRALGMQVDETEDGATLHGGVRLGSGTIESHGDHRIAMAFAIAGQISDGEVRINDIANVATSFPDFDGLARSAGFNLA
jgi:3-phosphoshikimate 1-carboxyvinyltransferase